MALHIDITRGEFGTCKVKLTGYLDTNSYQQLNAALEEPLADPEVRALRMEIEDLVFISSMGIGSFLRAKKAIEGRGGVFAVVGAQPQIQKVFDIVRVLPKETVFSSVAEADEYLTTIQNRILHGDHPSAAL